LWRYRAVGYDADTESALLERDERGALVLHDDAQQSIDALRAEVEFHKLDASALRSQMDVLRDGLASERERAESLRAELAEQCRLHAIGMERELALIGRADRAEAEAAAKQARIDELMLEYCPDEMTPEQIENWKRHQVPAIDAARKGAE